MSLNQKASKGSQGQQEPMKMIVDSTEYHLDGHVKTLSCLIVVQHLLLTCSGASVFSSRDLMNSFVAVSFASLETRFGTAVVVDLLTMVQDPDFAKQIFNI